MAARPSTQTRHFPSPEAVRYGRLRAAPPAGRPGMPLSCKAAHAWVTMPQLRQTTRSPARSGWWWHFPAGRRLLTLPAQLGPADRDDRAAAADALIEKRALGADIVKAGFTWLGCVASAQPVVHPRAVDEPRRAISNEQR
jgi:hypothetical protein